MNRLTAQPDLLGYSHALRDELLGALHDADLDFDLGGTTLSLRRLLLEQGSFQAAYTRAFQTYTLRFDVPPPADLPTVADFRTWFAQLDAEMFAALDALDDTALKRPVDRGGRYSPAVEVSFFTYRETLIILAAKVSVYLRAMGRELPKQVRGWVG